MTTLWTRLFPVTEIDPEHYRVFLVTNYIAYLAIVVHLAFVPMFQWLGVTPLSYFNILSATAWVAIFTLNRRGEHRLAIVIGVAEVVIHAILSVYFLGWASGAHYYLLPLVPFLYFNARQSTPIIIAESIAVLVLYIVMFKTLQSPPPGYDFDLRALSTLNYVNIAINFTALAILGYYHRRASHDSELKLRRLATTDPLTGLFNRRRILELLEQLDDESLERNWHLVLADIDHFKKFNDQYGHDCGDHVLTKVSALLLKGIGDSGHLSRWGGEEFLLIIYEDELDQCRNRVETIRQSVADNCFRFEDQEMSVTLTFGICPFERGLPYEQAITRADGALYQGKQDGRNRVNLA